MSEPIGEVTKQLLNYKPVRILLIIALSLAVALAILFTIIHFYRCSKDRNSRLLWGLHECIECKQVRIDSITKHDTIRIPTLTPQKKAPVKPSPKGNTQIIDSGGSGIQNNAPNYAPQAGRDMYLTEYNLDNAQLEKALTMVEEERRVKNITDKCVRIGVSSSSNGQKVAAQLSDFFKLKGFKVLDGGMSIYTVPLKGIEIGKLDGEDCVSITIGNL